MIEFTEEEKALIGELSVAGGWDSKAADLLKAKIKPHLLARTENCCCYCRRSMHKWHQLTIDIEHVLPKGGGKFPEYSFEVRNLSVSCKRCNMGIKGGDVSFFLGAKNEDPFKSELYKFIHPNLDSINDHLRILSVQLDAKLMLKYQIVGASEKGTEAYEYFELEKLEINSFDEAQGLDGVVPSEALPSDLARELSLVLSGVQGSAAE